MGLPCQVFQPEALELCARKVVAASGDMHKCFRVCRGVVEMLETKLTNDIEMQKLLRILLCFFLFLVTEVKCIPRADGEEMLKKKDIFVHKITIYKNLSQFCNNC